MRILHTMLRVGDLDKSIDFYVNRLGMNLFRKNQLWQMVIKYKIIDSGS